MSRSIIAYDYDDLYGQMHFWTKAESLMNGRPLVKATVVWREDNCFEATLEFEDD